MNTKDMMSETVKLMVCAIYDKSWTIAQEKKVSEVEAFAEGTLEVVTGMVDIGTPASLIERLLSIVGTLVSKIEPKVRAIADYKHIPIVPAHFIRACHFAADKVLSNETIVDDEINACIVTILQDGKLWEREPSPIAGEEGLCLSWSLRNPISPTSFRNLCLSKNPRIRTRLLTSLRPLIGLLGLRRGIVL